MSVSEWGVYLSVVLASTLSPGPAVLLAMNNGATRGLRAAACSSLGNISGLALLALAALMGVGGLLLASPAAYRVLQGLGALYLLYLGVAKWPKRGAASLSEQAPPGGRQRCAALFLQGMLVALSNPKAIVFFMALLPQFITPERPVFSQFLTLTGLLMGFSFAALMGYAALSRWGRGRPGGTMFQRLCALIFIVLGGWLFWSAVV